ncbi:MAG: tetratricopeptide (TPR) repeat protein [Cognaticolwellia sp.]
MSDSDSSDQAGASTHSGKKRAAIGCLSILLGVPLLFGAGWWYSQSQAERAQEQAAEEAFGPALQELTQQQVSPYDLDKTVRVLHGLDLAMESQEDLETHLAHLARQDYRGVSPDVLAARAELLGVLQKLYASQTELEEQEAMWAFSSKLLLSTLSIVQVGGEASMTGGQANFSVDRAQAQAVLANLEEEQAAERALQGDIRDLKTELFNALVDYSEVYYTHLEEWDRLCTLRDRAYLAANAGDWASAEVAAKAAMEMAPHETEAHLLYALAIVESGEMERADEVEAMLLDYIDQHPERSAPAFVILGQLHHDQGRSDQAHLDFQQAATYYPRQAEALTDMLNPYKMRSYLRATPEGGFVLGRYKDTMLGSGNFSPNLRQAHILFEEGDPAWKKAVLDHFYRRRSQGQWDYLMSDLQFCTDLFGERFREIYPNDSYLDLVVSSPMMGDGIKLSVRNRSERTLHNASLVMCLRFPDMHPDDYEAVPAGDTQQAVMSKDSTDFGTLEGEFTVGNRVYSAQDAYEHRAILVSNEGVMWVDTEPYKLAEAAEFRDLRAQQNSNKRESEWTQKVRTEAVADLQSKSTMRIEPSLGDDDLHIRLPEALSIGRPSFQLKYGDQYMRPEKNELENGMIDLVFAAVDNLVDGEHPPVELLVDTNFGGVRLAWIETPAGWVFGGVELD